MFFIKIKNKIKTDKVVPFYNFLFEYIKERETESGREDAWEMRKYMLFLLYVSSSSHGGGPHMETTYTTS